MSRSRMAAVAATLVCAFMLGGAGTAAAQSGSTTDLTKRIGVSGKTKKGGKKFNGTYTINRFVSRNGRVYSVGTLKGKLNNRRVNRSGVRLPARNFGLAPVGAQAAQVVCRVLTLTLGPLDLNLLGLRVQLNRINLRITAIPGGGLLGDLLCGIANLLNPPAIAGRNQAAVLNSLLALVPARP